MSHVHDIPLAEVTPTRDALLRGQGLQELSQARPPVLEAADEALRMFVRLVRSIAVTETISHEAFRAIYHSEGRNEPECPIENVYRRAERLTLFAATVGAEICQEISRLFAINEFVLGGFLDTAASEGADLISHYLERMEKEGSSKRDVSDFVVLAYSPGYCGWHISAQKRLFEALHPDQIGITLRDSYLMEPLKSISGVILSGAREIHIFDNTFPFCSQCRAQPCRGSLWATTETNR